MDFIPISQGKVHVGPTTCSTSLSRPLPHPCFPGRRRWEGRERNSFLNSETHRLGLIGNLTPWCVSSEVQTGSRLHCLPLDSCLLLSSSAGHSLGVHAGPDSDCACSRKFLHLFHVLNQSTHSYKSLFHPQGSEQGADSAGGWAVCLL